MTEAQNIYVELEIRAIKGGTEWQSTTLRYPRQSVEMYTVIEAAISKTLIDLGYAGIELKRAANPLAVNK